MSTASRTTFPASPRARSSGSKRVARRCDRAGRRPDESASCHVGLIPRLELLPLAAGRDNASAWSGTIVRVAGVGFHAIVVSIDDNSRASRRDASASDDRVRVALPESESGAGFNAQAGSALAAYPSGLKGTVCTFKFDKKRACKPRLLHDLQNNPRPLGQPVGQHFRPRAPASTVRFRRVFQRMPPPVLAVLGVAQPARNQRATRAYVQGNIFGSPRRAGRPPRNCRSAISTLKADCSGARGLLAIPTRQRHCPVRRFQRRGRRN